MWEQIIVIAIVVAAAGAIAYSFYKSGRGKGSCCDSSCQCDSPDKKGSS